MKIGLLSDTHSFLDPKVFNHFSTCDEIWHAGDIGDASLIKELEDFKPVKAVYGNIDGKDIQSRFLEDLHWNCEGLNIWMTHIGGAPPNYNPRVKRLLAENPPALFICGHSHILKIRKDPNINNMLYLNPGAAGNHGFHAIKTLVRFEIKAAQIVNMEVIELGKRGAISQS